MTLKIGVLQTPRVVIAYPPNIEAIRAVIPGVTNRAIFAYDGVIYNPGGGLITAELFAHEMVHFKQQSDVGGAEMWWARYLAFPEWRYAQELEAHRVEYLKFRSICSDRNKHARHLREMGMRLSGPLYGGLATYKEAVDAIRRKA